ncbi:MAG TPA: hypothetical protein VN951_03090 [Pyrinomonadaceae bacterium]|nr:hypothetical protein [Pyrinomonadaceae bacterium]
MNALSGMLIEYLVIGAIASLWLFPAIVKTSFFSQFASKELFGVAVAVLVPAVYLVGMLCDLIGYLATHRLKKHIEARHGKTASSQLVHVYAVANAPNLAHEMEVRSTRDRIARGSMVAFFPLLFFSPVTSLPRWATTLTAAAIIVLLAGLWWRFQSLSAKYEGHVRTYLEEKFAVNFQEKKEAKPSADFSIKKLLSLLIVFAFGVLIGALIRFQ